MSILTDIFDVAESAISGKRKNDDQNPKIIVIEKKDTSMTPEKSTNIA
jgi:hypothetical protein